MAEHIHDVLVIGAGPSGSAAAAVLAEHSLDVLLIDRSEFPREKVCGDGLAVDSMRLLKKLGVLEKVTDAGCQSTDTYTSFSLHQNDSGAIRF